MSRPKHIFGLIILAAVMQLAQAANLLADDAQSSAKAKALSRLVLPEALGPKTPMRVFRRFSGSDDGRKAVVSGVFLPTRKETS